MSEKINLNVTLSLRIKNTVASVAQIMVDIVMAPIVDQLCLKKKIKKNRYTMFRREFDFKWNCDL